MNETIHCIGIGGSGMLPLAELLLKKGYGVTGSDRLMKQAESLDALSPPIRKRLQRLSDMGAKLFPQDGSGVSASTTRIVASTAIEDDNPDLQKAKSLGLPALHRSEELCRQIQDKPLIAITGTSGKSTTTAMCAWLLKHLGELGCFVGGAELLLDTAEGWSSVLAEGGAWNCAELDESDKSFFNFQPDIAVVLNVKRDHHSQEENLEAFMQFCASVKKAVILNRNDEGCQQLAKHIGDSGKVVWYDPPDKEAIRHTPNGIVFSIDGVSFELPQIGYHSAFNFAAAHRAIRAAIANVSPEQVQAAARTFPGVRRRQHRYGTGEPAVYDDYAHNPDKLAALLDCLQERHPRVRLVFQPHGYAPLRFHLDGYAEVFTRQLRPQDELYLLPIYDAGGTTNRTICSQDLAVKIEQHLVFTVKDREELQQRLQRETFPNDVIAVAGARDDTLAELADTIAQSFAARAD